MKKLLQHTIAIALGAIALTIISNVAHAAAVPPSTTKLTYDQATQLLGALNALDGYAKPVDQGKDKPPAIILIHYEFSGAVNKAIAHDINAVKAAMKDDDDALARIRTEHGIGQGPTPSAAEQAQANKEWLAVIATPIEIPNLTPISPDDLNLDANSIPSSIVAALAVLAKP